MNGEVGGVLRLVLYLVCLRRMEGSGAMILSGEVVGLAQRGGREGALAFAAGKAVAVPSSVVTATIDAIGTVWSQVGAGAGVGWA